MNEIEISDLLKKLIVSLKEAFDALEESDEYKELLAECEELDKSNPDYEEKMQELEERGKRLETDAKAAVLGSLSEEQKMTILNTLSPDFINENSVPIEGNNGRLFAEILVYISNSFESGLVHNELISSDKFVDAMSFSGLVLEKVVLRCTEPEKVKEFFFRYKQGFAPVNINGDFFASTSNNNLGGVLLKIFNNPNLTSEFKMDLLLSDDNELFLDEYYLGEILKSELLSKEEKLKLLNNEKIYNRLPNYNFSLVLASICTSYDDIKGFIESDTLAGKIDIGNFICNVKLVSSEFKKVLQDEHIFAKLDWLSLARILKDSEMSYEDRKDILLDDKFFSKLNGLAVADILCSKYLTSEQRIELLTNEKIFDAMFKENNYLYKLFEMDGIPLKDRIAILQDERFYPYISSAQIESSFASSEADLEVCTDILFNENLFYRLIGEYHPQYNPNSFDKGPFKYDKYEVLKKLHERNPQIAKTLSVELLKDDLLDLGFAFIETMSKYPSVAHRLAETLRYGEFLTIKNMIKVLQSIDNVNEINIAEFVSKIIEISQDKSYYGEDPEKASNFSKVRFDSDLNFGSLTEEEWKTLMEIGFRDHSFYNKGIIQGIPENIIIPVDISQSIMPDIKTREDLQSFHDNRLTLCDEEFYRSVSEGDLDKAKNAYFNKYFSITLDEAKQIVRMYNTSLQELKSKPEFAKQTKYLSAIGNALDIESLDVLSNVYNSNSNVMTFAERLFMDQFIRQMFSQTMSDSVFKTEGATQTYIEVMENGVPKQITVYEPGFDFKMLIHSTAAYGQMQLINDNYFDSWNKSSRKTNHGICCSLISNDNLGMAAVNDVLLGFDSWAPGSISKSAPYDIYSKNDGYNIEEGRILTFMSPSDIINNTRHTHNEQVLERFELRDDKRTPECQNIQPAYVIIYNDMTDEIKLKAVKCSEELHIPIVYLDKEKIVNNEVSKIDNLIQRISTSASMEEKITLLEKVLVSHENNRSGLRMTNKDLVDAYFPTDKITNLFEMLIAKIKSDYLAVGDVASYNKYANMILDVLDKENGKYVALSEVSDRVNVIDIPVQRFRESIMGAVNKDLAGTNTPKLGAIVSDAGVSHPETSFTKALAGADISLIETMVADVMQKGLYNESLEISNIGHIERTAALANLIGKKELVNEEGIVDSKAMDILMTAIMYHDCAKENYYKDPRHGKKSAGKMFECINSKAFTDDEKKILSIIVEFHEDNNLKEKFEMICQRSGLNPKLMEYARKIAYALQDANNLDRIPSDELMLEYSSPLNFKGSRSLIEIADTLKRYYGTIDRTLFTQICNNLSMTVSLEDKEVQDLQEGTGRK